MRKISITVDRQKLLRVVIMICGCVLAGYYGASLARAQRDLTVCEMDELTGCHIEWSIWGFETVGRP